MSNVRIMLITIGACLVALGEARGDGALFAVLGVAIAVPLWLSSGDRPRDEQIFYNTWWEAATDGSALKLLLLLLLGGVLIYLAATQH